MSITATVFKVIPAMLPLTEFIKDGAYPNTYPVGEPFIFHIVQSLSVILTFWRKRACTSDAKCDSIRIFTICTALACNICGSYLGIKEHLSSYKNQHSFGFVCKTGPTVTIINVTSNVGISISSLVQNGAEVEEPRTMPDIFNNVFVNTAHKINEKIPVPDYYYIRLSVM